MNRTATDVGPITRDDLEAGFRRLQGEAASEVTSARSGLVTAGLAAALVALVLAYLAGRRRGRSRSAVVEIRRI
ncbi:MAG: hypothetical protein ACP5P9_10165 [Acidimicrobiales bacterium]